MQKYKSREAGFPHFGCDECDEIYLEIRTCETPGKCFAINHRCQDCKDKGGKPLYKEIDIPRIKLKIIQGGIK